MENVHDFYRTHKMHNQMLLLLSLFTFWYLVIDSGKMTPINNKYYFWRKGIYNTFLYNLSIKC